MAYWDIYWKSQKIMLNKNLQWLNIFKSHLWVLSWIPITNAYGHCLFPKREKVPLSIWTYFLTFSSLKYRVWWTRSLVYFKNEFYRQQHTRQKNLVQHWKEIRFIKLKNIKFIKLKNIKNQLQIDRGSIIYGHYVTPTRVGSLAIRPYITVDWVELLTFCLLCIKKWTILLYF